MVQLAACLTCQVVLHQPYLPLPRLFDEAATCPGSHNYSPIKQGAKWALSTCPDTPITSCLDRLPTPVLPSCYLHSCSRRKTQSHYSFV